MEYRLEYLRQIFENYDKNLYVFFLIKTTLLMTWSSFL